MLEAGDIKASIVDITRKFRFGAPQVAMDANVLYYNFYPNFRDLYNWGGNCPPEYVLDRYGSAIKQALTGKIKLVSSATTFGEFLKTMEFSDIEILRITDSNQPPLQYRFTPRDCKEARYDYCDLIGKIRRDLCGVLASARKIVSLLKCPPAGESMNLATQQWCKTLSDYPDSVFVAEALASGIRHFVSHDCDLATFDGITLYTANYVTVKLGREAGKVLN